MMKNKLLAMLFALFIAVSGANARNYFGDTLSLKQPDGTSVQVKVYGNEFYQDVESLDGYTLIRDGENNVICYALLSDDGNEYQSSGIRYNGGEAPAAVKMIIQPGIRISAESIKSKIAACRKSLMGDNANGETEILKRSISYRNLPDTVYGVTILIDFPDVKSSITREQVERFCNGDNYNEFGNARSIKEYFQWISSGKLTYINKVVGFYTAPREKSYYDCPSENATPGNGYHDEDIMRDVIVPSLNKEEGFKLSELTTNNGGILAINIFYAGTADAGWANGLWGHQGWWNSSFGALNGFAANAGHTYQMCDLGSELTINTFIHENGHMVCGWPDFYSYDGHSDNNASRYGIGGPADFGNNYKNPNYPNPYVLDAMGWLVNKHDITNITDGSTYRLSAEPGSAAVFNGTKGSNSPYERYYLQVRYDTPDNPENYNGIFIWHVNTQGNNTYAGYPEELDCRPATTNDPCFKAGLNDEFNDNTDPSAKWDNGRYSLIKIWRISEAGPTMTFRVGTAIIVPELVTRDHGMSLGVQGRDSLEVLGGSRPYTFRATGELPAGLQLDSTGILSGTPTEAGDYYVPIVISSRYRDGNDTLQIQVAASTSYGNTPTALPGNLLFTRYDKGGEGIAYHDTENENIGNANYRTDEGVDFIRLNTTGTLFGVSHTESGEWFQFSVNVAEAGTYTATLRYATLDSTNQISVLPNGLPGVRAVKLPSTNTDGNIYADYEEYSFDIDLQAGEQKIRFYIDNASNLNLYRLGFEKKETEDTGISDLQEESNQPVLTTDGNGNFQLTAAQEIKNLRIINTNGQILDEYAPASNEFSFGSELPHGIYLIEVTTANGQHILKVAK
ncbi:MAG: putative Ig domain-containing protein [Bacteroidaceae bacterium]|jgi:M6 family metalloprotease-like protein